MANDQQTTTIDFTQPPSAVNATSSSIDFSQPPHAVKPATQSEPWYEHIPRNILNTLGLPETLSDVPDWFKNQYTKDPFTGEVAKKGDEAKNFLINLLKTGNPASTVFDQLREAAKPEPDVQKRIAAAVPIVGPIANKASEQVKNEDYTGAAGTLLALPLSAAAPEAMARTGELASSVAGKLSPVKTVEGALNRTLSAQEATTARSSSTAQPALNVTPKEVLEHAAQSGVKLTPGQALEDPAAANVQKMGTTAMVGGKDLALALRDQRYAFVDSVNKLSKTIDPQGVGVNDETAGHTIQRAVQQNLDSLKGKASSAYNQVNAQQQDLKGNLNSLYGVADAKQFEKITDSETGAVTQRKIYQPPAVQAALDDIQDAPKRLGDNPSIASMRSLRSEFWEKGNDYTGNIPDSARALYKQAAAAIDNSITDAARGTPFETTFRDANSQWKALQSKYNEPGEPLYKILQQNDPTKIVAQLQNAPAQDVALLRQELGDGAAVQALRRSVVNDIANNKFTVKNSGLGGYSHEYLNALFGVDVTKQLYLKADLARRINYDANPSGTGSAMSVLEQGGSLKQQPKLTAFAKLSMPRDASSFLPKQTTQAVAPASNVRMFPALTLPPVSNERRSGSLSEMAVP